MAVRFIDVDLSVIIDESRILAHLEFSNNTADKLLLDKFIICYNNRIRNNFFKVIDENGCRIDYVGPLVKRYITSEDFMFVQPGEKIVSNVSLENVYKMVNGKKYTVQYSAYHPTDIEEQGIIKVESNVVNVVC